MRSELNDKTYNILRIKDKIKQVNKEFIQTYNDANSKATSSDYLWLLSCGEIWDNGYNGGVTRGVAIATEGSQYKFYKNKLGNASCYSNLNILRKPDESGKEDWWLRSVSYQGDSMWAYIYGAGGVIGSAYGAVAQLKVAPGFSI